MTAAEARVDAFLVRLKFKQATGEITGLKILQVDCYAFYFRPQIDGPDQVAFTEYMQGLDLADRRAVAKMAIWLIQRGVGFDFRFKWNPRAPFWHNISNLWFPFRLRRMLARVMDLIPSYDLAADTAALKRKEDGDT